VEKPQGIQHTLVHAEMFTGYHGGRIMRGTDVTQAQFDEAEHFLTAFVLQRHAPKPGQNISIEWQKFVRVVAWYGAIRADGIARAGATVDGPGRCSLVPQS
jgi:hypothetical protein